MARQITILEIPDVMEEAVETLVAATTLEWTARVKKATPVDTGRLRAAWQTDIKKFEGIVSNNLPYAEPVCFGENLPPSWNNQYRTRQKTQAGFPELIAKELQKWAGDEYEKIKRRI
tara:strand:+ start:190 stop:540 length:351 start_codon:yes stop_codon:yes gene_type:complete